MKVKLLKMCVLLLGGIGGCAMYGCYTLKKKLINKDEQLQEALSQKEQAEREAAKWQKISDIREESYKNLLKSKMNDNISVYTNPYNPVTRLL